MNATSVVVYADGNQQISFYISSVDEDGRESEMTSVTTTSGPLRKFFYGWLPLSSTFRF